MGKIYHPSQASIPPRDVVSQPLYDSVILKSGDQRLTLFCKPVGLLDHTADEKIHESKTHEETNMYLAGVLPAGNDFYLTSVGVFFVPNIAGARAAEWNRETEIEDTLTVLGRGHLEFYIGNRVYFRCSPLAALRPHFPMYWGRDDKQLLELFSSPPEEVAGPKDEDKEFFDPLTAEAQRMAGMTPYGSDEGFKLIPLHIAALQGFGVRVEFPKRFRLHNPGKLGVLLYGRMMRDVY